MLRSKLRNITIVDRALYLWVLCTIEWAHEHNEPLSNNNLTRLFGETIKYKFNFYREIAMDNKDVAPDSLHLTPKGQRIVDNWRRFSELILDV